MEIPEYMEHENMNILEKMEQWDTRKDIGKDLDPYLDYVCDKLDANDTSLINELDTLKKILSKVETQFKMLRMESGTHMEAYEDAMDVLYKLPGHNNGKLKKLLNDQTGLTETQKRGILQAWEEASVYHWGCLPSKDLTPMEECIRTKGAEIAEFIVKTAEYNRRVLALLSLVHRTEFTIDSIEHPSFEKDKRASSTHQLKMRKSTKDKRVDENITSSTHQLKRCKSKDKRVSSTHQLKMRKSTKDKRVDENITSSTHQLKMRKSTKDKRVDENITSSTHQLKRRKSTKDKRIDENITSSTHQLKRFKCTSSPKASEQ